MLQSLILVSSEAYFKDLVTKAISFRKVKASPSIQNYLVKLLEYYLDAKNLQLLETNEKGERQPQTLAEMFLQSIDKNEPHRLELLKRIGDQALYMSGFFGESFARKIIDIDYYMDMGSIAYSQLASNLGRHHWEKKVFQSIGKRFIEFVDVLTYISHETMIQNDQNLLRLYESFIRTGSELAKEKLVEKGIIPHRHRKSA